MQGTTGKNLLLWGAISYEQGHYTSLVRTTGTSNEWLVVTICSSVEMWSELSQLKKNSTHFNYCFVF